MALGGAGTSLPSDDFDDSQERMALAETIRREVHRHCWQPYRSAVAATEASAAGRHQR